MRGLFNAALVLAPALAFAYAVPDVAVGKVRGHAESVAGTQESFGPPRAIAYTNNLSYKTTQLLSPMSKFGVDHLMMR